jgi:hypothetical protein
MEIVWKYLTGGRVKHKFTVHENTSDCGVSAEWWMRKQWKTDEAKLKELPKCARCGLVK